MSVNIQNGGAFGTVVRCCPDPALPLVTIRGACPDKPTHPGAHGAVRGGLTAPIAADGACRRRHQGWVDEAMPRRPAAQRWFRLLSICSIKPSARSASGSSGWRRLNSASASTVPAWRASSNSSATAIFGSRAAGVVLAGPAVLDFAGRSCIAELLALFAAMSPGETSAIVTNTASGRDGTCIPVLVSLVLVFPVSGVPAGVPADNDGKRNGRRTMRRLSRIIAPYDVAFNALSELTNSKELRQRVFNAGQ